MSKEDTLQAALGLMGIHNPKSVAAPSLKTSKTPPIHPPNWFGPVVQELLGSEPPLVDSKMFSYVQLQLHFAFYIHPSHQS